MNNKVNTLIQFAKRAKKVSYKQTLGFHLLKNKVGVVLVASDISENTLKEFSSFKKVKFLTYLTKEELGLVLSKEQVSIVGILDFNISKQIIKLLKEEENNG